MSQRSFALAIATLGAAFTILFCVVVVPELIRHPKVFDAFAAGFVNPFASGYAMDAITCWCILTVWVVHEAKAKGVKHGWVAVLLGIAPGVAAGLAVYLLIRARQLDHHA